MRRLACFFGLHDWLANRRLTLLDAFPPPFLPYDEPLRECRRCGKRQRWLPGYGGSEIGCWMTDDRPAAPGGK